MFSHTHYLFEWIKPDHSADLNCNKVKNFNSLGEFIQPDASSAGFSALLSFNFSCNSKKNKIINYLACDTQVDV